jgi:LCP family protein required for cell wall assembly
LLASATGGLVYSKWRLSQIKTVNAKHLVKVASAGAPFTILLVGSDSRQFVDDQSEANQFGTSSDAGGQRSDVTIVARVVPATKKVLLMSIPRDLWVDIPGDESGVSGYNRINAAFNNGPDLLIQTIETDLGIPINYYAEVGFPGFASIVNALGGIYMNFPDKVYDDYSQLKITQTGCQLINGSQALALVRSRHLYYLPAGDNYYQYDGESDFSRIQRQDAFFRAVITRAHEQVTNPLALNSFVGAATSDITVDPTLKSQLLSLAEHFSTASVNSLQTETLPTTETQNSAGDVLDEAQPYDDQMIEQFLNFGSQSVPATTTTTPSTVPSVSHSEISVTVLNGAGISKLASRTAAELTSVGYKITSVGDAPASDYVKSLIEYGPDGQKAEKTLAASVQGGTVSLENATLTGDNLVLIAGSTITGIGGAAAPTTTTTIPSGPATPPGNVVTNTQLEPWNPVPCAG